MHTGKATNETRATLYGIARLLGVSVQTVYQQAKRHPEAFIKGADGRYNAKAVISFIEGRAKPKLRKNQTSPLTEPLRAILARLRAGEPFRVSDLLEAVETVNETYLQAVRELLLNAGLDPSKAVESFTAKLEGIATVQEELKRKAGL